MRNYRNRHVKKGGAAIALTVYLIGLSKARRNIYLLSNKSCSEDWRYNMFVFSLLQKGKSQHQNDG